MATYNMVKTVDGSFDAVKTSVTEALSEQGFGILTEIDVQATLKKKLDEDMERYEILGACNPQLAHTALEADRTIGLLLPCNVVLRESDSGIEVSIMDPEAMFSVADEAVKRDLSNLPAEAKARLERALETL